LAEAMAEETDLFFPIWRSFLHSTRAIHPVARFMNYKSDLVNAAACRGTKRRHIQLGGVAEIIFQCLAPTTSRNRA